MEGSRFDNSRSMQMRTLTYVFILLGFITMIVSTSYAWFTISQNPRVSDMELYVNAPPGVSIATRYDAPDEEWGEHIEFSQLVDTDSPLKPVTWSDADGVFKTIRYGLDGRQRNQFRTLTDSDNANTGGDKQYYIRGTFYAKTGTSCVLSLTEPTTMSNGVLGSGTYVTGASRWVEASRRHEDLGRGAQYAIRIGFRVSRIDSVTGEIIDTNSFVIYEPNADRHQDNGTTQILSTASIDGRDELVSLDRLIRQTTSTWVDASPAQSGVTVKTLGKFTTATEVFRLEANQMARIDMYVWLEGQDYDCSGVPHEAYLFANVQFDADYGEQSGLVDIPTA